MWEVEELNLGVVKPNSKTKFEFLWKGEPLVVNNIITSCGCTSVKFTDNKLKGTFKAGQIPRHLSYKNEFNTQKLITLETEKGLFKLRIKVKIKK